MNLSFSVIFCFLCVHYVRSDVTLFSRRVPGMQYMTKLNKFLNGEMKNMEEFLNCFPKIEFPYMERFDHLDWLLKVYQAITLQSAYYKKTNIQYQDSAIQQDITDINEDLKQLKQLIKSYLSVSFMGDDMIPSLLTYLAALNTVDVTRTEEDLLMEINKLKTAIKKTDGRSCTEQLKKTKKYGKIVVLQRELERQKQKMNQLAKIWTVRYSKKTQIVGASSGGKSSDDLEIERTDIFGKIKMVRERFRFLLEEIRWTTDSLKAGNRRISQLNKILKKSTILEDLALAKRKMTNLIAQKNSPLPSLNDLSGKYQSAINDLKLKNQTYKNLMKRYSIDVCGHVEYRDNYDRPPVTVHRFIPLDGREIFMECSDKRYKDPRTIRILTAEVRVAPNEFWFDKELKNLQEKSDVPLCRNEVSKEIRQICNERKTCKLATSGIDQGDCDNEDPGLTYLVMKYACVPDCDLNNFIDLTPLIKYVETEKRRHFMPYGEYYDHSVTMDFAEITVDSGHAPSLSGYFRKFRLGYDRTFVFEHVTDTDKSVPNAFSVRGVLARAESNDKAIYNMNVHNYVDQLINNPTCTYPSALFYKQIESGQLYSDLYESRLRTLVATYSTGAWPLTEKFRSMQIFTWHNTDEYAYTLKGSIKERGNGLYAQLLVINLTQSPQIIIMLLDPQQTYSVQPKFSGTTYRAAVPESVKLASGIGAPIFFLKLKS